jgi:hypothetical protein
MKEICVDAGFLIGLYNPRDQFYTKAQDYYSNYFSGTTNRLLVPWPILYETMSTKMASNKEAMFRLENTGKGLPGGIGFSCSPMNRSAWDSWTIVLMTCGSQLDPTAV